MAKYIPKEFAPNVFPAWLEIFKTLTQEERSELLLAISGYPNYVPQINIALWPFFKGELDRQHAKFTARNSQQKANRIGSTTDNDGEPRLTTVDHGRPKENAVDQSAEHKTITITGTGNIEHKTENSEQDIDTHPSPSAQDASVSTPPAKKAKRTSVCKPADVPENLWCDWIALRKQKRLPLTAQALALVQAEATKAGKTLAEVLQICLQNSWAGFRASWLTNATNTQQQTERPFYTPTHDWEEERKEHIAHAEALMRAALGGKA